MPKLKNYRTAEAVASAYRRFASEACSLVEQIQDASNFLLGIEEPEFLLPDEPTDPYDGWGYEIQVVNVADSPELHEFLKPNFRSQHYVEIDILDGREKALAKFKADLAAWETGDCDYNWEPCL